ncbi:hypothetical protein TanjilG_09879 [Lupinus angustifolius]|uniref:Uncharacterized protein n=1 Tax=Lupinus angustifolius TaxID=3871 RepID=A0A1J7GCV9_LUPAN|nr:hypothetical protein TanjilG_09879 [Lupinus angustifolius]
METNNTHALHIGITCSSYSWGFPQRVYGYKPDPEVSSESVEIETDRESVASLAKALYTAIRTPIAICVPLLHLFERQRANENGCIS